MCQSFFRSRDGFESFEFEFAKTNDLESQSGRVDDCFGLHTFTFYTVVTVCPARPICFAINVLFCHDTLARLNFCYCFV